MSGIIITLIFAVSLAYAAYAGRLDEVSAAAMSSCVKAVDLSLTLGAGMALWGGFMSLCEKCGAAKAISRLLRPLVRKVFGLSAGEENAANAVSMNITANLLGIGNASTPLGIEAARQLDKSGGKKQRNIALLVVLNTASIQLIPTTIAALRAAHGSMRPFEITPAVIVTSMVSAFVGCKTAALLYSGDKTDE